jgi:hypothetical protein
VFFLQKLNPVTALKPSGVSQRGFFFKSSVLYFWFSLFTYRDPLEMQGYKIRGIYLLAGYLALTLRMFCRERTIPLMEFGSTLLLWGFFSIEMKSFRWAFSMFHKTF